SGGTHPIVERARTTSRQLADLPGVKDAIAELDQAWKRSPWVLALEGAQTSRTDFLNIVLGGRVLEHRDPNCATLHVRRGSETRFVATRRDGTTERHTLAVRPDGADDSATRLARADAARAEHHDREQALARSAGRLPAWLTRPLTGWRLVLWPLAWLLKRRY